MTVIHAPAAASSQDPLKAGLLWPQANMDLATEIEPVFARCIACPIRYGDQQPLPTHAAQIDSFALTIEYLEIR